MGRCVAGQTKTFGIELGSVANAGKFQVAPTLDAADFSRSINGGAFAALANTPTVSPAGGAQVVVVLAAAETTAAGAGGRIHFRASDSSGNQWQDLAIDIDVYATAEDTLVATVTNLTNAPTNGDLTATMKTSVTTAATAATPTAAAVTGNVGGNVNGNVVGSVGSVTGAVGSVTAAVTVGTNNDKTGYALSSAGIQAIWDALTAALTTVGSIGKLLVDNINATISSRSSHTAANVRTEMDSNSTQLAKLGTPAGASISADIAAVKAETASIQSDTNDLQTQIGTAGAGLTAITSLIDTEVAAILAAVDTEVAAIKAKTDNLPTDPADASDIAASIATLATASALTTLSDKIGTPAGLTVSADVAAIKAETASIQSDTNDLQTQIGAAGAGLTAIASAANLATLTGYVDTEVAAIKAKTDLIPASPAATGDIPTDAEVAAAVWAYVTRTLTSAGAGGATAQEVWEYATRTLTSAGAGGATAQEVWEYVTRTLTTGVTLEDGAITAAKIAPDALTAAKFAADVTTEFQAGLATAASIAALNNLSAAQINAEVDTAIADAALATQASVNTLAGYVDTEVAAILAAVDTEVAAIKAKTDNLPTDPADESSIQATLATISTYVDTEVAAIKAKTDLIPAQPTAVSNIPTAATIADAVWDELQVGHVAAGTFGAYLDEQVSAISGGSGATAQEVWEYPTRILTSAGAGGATAQEVWEYATRTLTSLGTPGGIEFTYTLTSSVGGLPIPGVTVWIATDAAISNVVWAGITDAFGVALDIYGNKPRLDAGTYHILSRKFGFSFPVDVETVA